MKIKKKSDDFVKPMIKLTYISI